MERGEQDPWQALPNELDRATIIVSSKAFESVYEEVALQIKGVCLLGCFEDIPTGGTDDGL